MPANTRFEHKDRVEFSSRGRTVYGTVIGTEGGLVKVMADGGRNQFTVPSARLSFSSRSVRRDLPSEMDVWQVEDFACEQGRGLESPRFTATITRHGAPMIGASNEGYGAPDRYLPFDGGYAVIEELAASVDDWLRANGGEPSDFMEPVNFWLLWRAREAPYGVLAAEAIEEYLAVTEPAAQCEVAADQDVDAHAPRI